VPVPVIVEPRPGHTDEEVVTRLMAQSAREVSVLSPGFISAELPPSQFESMEAIAVIQPKVRKQTR